MMAGHPAALLRPLSLPVHQVLPATMAHVQKPLDGIGRMVINELLQEQTGLMRDTWKVG